MSDDWYQDYDDDDLECAGSDAEESPYPSSDENDENDGDETAYQQPAPHSALSQKSKAFTVIDKPGLQRIQDEALDQVKGILGCNTTTARALLIFFNWDTEAVLGTIVERGQEAVYRRAGITSQSEEAAHPSGEGIATCMVCMSDVRPGEVSSMSCGHTFCDTCWREHLRVGIVDGMSRRLKCMAPSCGVICDEDMVKQLLRSNRMLLQKYQQSLLDSYVDDNRRVKWCPSVPHCGNAVRCNKDPFCEVECACSHRFCFNCTSEPHSPATCQMFADWERRMRDGTETSSWLSANTKPCPKCGKSVEKAGGCNLVVCRCGQAFCWLCGQATGREHTWTSIAGHSCGAYKEEADRRTDQAQRSLKRYLHYLTRYEAHLQSLKMEEKQREAIDLKIDQLMERESSLFNFSWLNEAMQQLFLSRRILSFSYIFAFFTFGGAMFKDDFTPEQNTINQQLFEDKQGQLEVEVERLAKLIESSPEEIVEDRMHIINLAANIDKRILKMYEVIENDIAGQVTTASLDIAPYRGRHAQASGGVAVEVLHPPSGMDLSDSPSQELAGSSAESPCMDLTGDSEGEQQGPSSSRAAGAGVSTDAADAAVEAGGGRGGGCAALAAHPGKRSRTG